MQNDGHLIMFLATLSCCDVQVCLNFSGTGFYFKLPKRSVH